MENKEQIIFSVYKRSGRTNRKYYSFESRSTDSFRFYSQTDSTVICVLKYENYANKCCTWLLCKMIYFILYFIFLYVDWKFSNPE